MSITMQRMIDIISAADEVMNTYREKRELLTRIWQNDIAPGGRISVANAISADPNADVNKLRKAMKMWYEVVEGYVDQMKDIEFPIQALLTLERERTHFKYNKRKNELNADAVRMHRARKKIAEELRVEGKAPISRPTNMPSLNTNVSESPLNKTSEEIERDAREARERAEAWARGEDPDAAAPANYTREDYERDKAKRLSDDASPISVVRHEKDQ